MLFRSWLQNLRSALAPSGRDRRRRSNRAATHRPSLEVLEDRRVPAFLAPVDYAVVGNSLQDVVAADFNNDTVPDLGVIDYVNSTVSVLLGNGNGTFQPARTSQTGDGPLSLAVGDFDGDGNLDLATANANSVNVSVLMGDGAGRFTPGGTGISFYASPESVAVGDFNGDGRLDLGVTSYYYHGADQFVDVLLGNGDGSFRDGYSAWLGQGGYGDFSAVATDLNRDGFDDFVTATPSYAHVLLSNSSGGLQGHSSFYLGEYYYQDRNSIPVAAGDLDADGDTDLVVMGRVLLGNGAGGFNVAGYAASSHGAVVLGDFNGDGSLDVAQAIGGSVAIDRGQGNGAFSAAESFDANASDYGVAAADFDGDGWLDVATVGYSDGGSVLINNRSWPPLVSISNATVTEGNAGTANATFTITLSTPSTQPITIVFATGNDTATAGSDYHAATGTLTFAPGETSKTITVLVNGDRSAEPNEAFSVNLSSPTNATLGDSQGTGTIVDDEPRIGISDVSKSEGRKGKSTSFTFTITLSAAYDQPVTVSYRTLDGTAKTSDNDYVAKTGTITFAPGETSKTITIIVNGDKKKESNETFYLDLFGNSSNSLITKSRGIGTILNDD